MTPGTGKLRHGDAEKAFRPALAGLDRAFGLESLEENAENAEA